MPYNSHRGHADFNEILYHLSIKVYIKKYTKNYAVSCNWEIADHIEAEFSLNIRAKRVRISLTDTTHEAITVSEKSGFNLNQLYLCEKLFSLHFFNFFNVH